MSSDRPAGAVLFAMAREAYSVIGPSGWHPSSISPGLRTGRFQLPGRSGFHSAYIFGTGRQAAEQVAALIEKDPPAWVLLMGVCGALEPSLRPGDLVVPERAVYPGPSGQISESCRAFTACPSCAEALRPSGAILTVESPLCSVAAKSAAFSKTGAICVDMELFFLTERMAEIPVDFIALKAVSDPASQTVPAAAASALRPDGTADLPAILAGAVRRPWIIKDLIRLGAGFRRACSRLRKILPSAIGHLEACRKQRRQAP